jgi:hypothetical protein
LSTHGATTIIQFFFSGIVFATYSHKDATGAKFMSAIELYDFIYKDVVIANKAVHILNLFGIFFECNAWWVWWKALKEY